jgi:hypothetical protein
MMNQPSTLMVRQPTLGRVFRQQLRMLDAAQRAPLLLGIMVLPAVMWPGHGLLIPIRPMLLASIAWALLVWEGETRGRRTYHRCLPVDQTTHDLLKIAAGAVWLLSAVAITVGLLTVYLLWTDAPRGLLGLSPTMLISFFTSTLIVYLLISLFPLLTARPLEWLLGTVVVIAILGALPPFRDTPPGVVIAMLTAGIRTALLQPHMVAEHAVMPGKFPDLPEQTLAWLIATVLWLVSALALVTWASRRANARRAEPFGYGIMRELLRPPRAG